MPHTSPLHFKATVITAGKTATGIQVPAATVEALAAGKHPKVKVTINNYTYRSSIAMMGGKYMISISADVRAKAGVAAGDELNVQLDLDNEVREVAIPADLQQALDADPIAKTAFEKLSFSYKQRLVLPIEQAKTAETRQRRIDKVLSELQPK